MPKGSGLTKPMTLSDDLSAIVGAKKGEKLSRPEIVKRLWAYIKEHKLQVFLSMSFFSFYYMNFTPFCKNMVHNPTVRI